MMNEKQKMRIANYLGLAQRAGKIAAGDMLAKNALINGRAEMLILADDAAEKVKEELLAIAKECVPVLSWPTKAELGYIVGKSPRGALALLDNGFAKAIKKVCDEQPGSPEP